MKCCMTPITTGRKCFLLGQVEEYLTVRKVLSEAELLTVEGSRRYYAIT